MNRQQDPASRDIVDGVILATLDGVNRSRDSLVALSSKLVPCTTWPAHNTVSNPPPQLQQDLPSLHPTKRMDQDLYTTYSVLIKSTTDGADGLVPISTIVATEDFSLPHAPIRVSSSITATTWIYQFHSRERAEEAVKFFQGLSWAPMTHISQKLVSKFVLVVNSFPLSDLTTI